MAFTQPCFIRNVDNNKFPLIVALERLGYSGMYMSYRNNIGGSNLVCECQTWHCTDSDNKPDAIDCGTNEQLFLAIASLRDDTDLSQWFVDTTSHKLWYNDCMKQLPQNTPSRKATVNELIAYFNRS